MREISRQSFLSVDDDTGEENEKNKGKLKALFSLPFL